jgi:hypothetical protein
VSLALLPAQKMASIAMEMEAKRLAALSTAYYFGEDSRTLCDHPNGADRITTFQWGNQTRSDGVGVRTAKVGRYQQCARTL